MARGAGQPGGLAGLMKRGLVERATDPTDASRASLRLRSRGRVIHVFAAALALAA
jgi:hypothetical protein